MKLSLNAGKIVVYKLYNKNTIWKYKSVRKNLKYWKEFEIFSYFSFSFLQAPLLHYFLKTFHGKIALHWMSNFLDIRSAEDEKKYIICAWKYRYKKIWKVFSRVRECVHTREYVQRGGKEKRCHLTPPARPFPINAPRVARVPTLDLNSFAFSGNSMNCQPLRAINNAFCVCPR